MHETLLPREFFGGRLRRLRPPDREAFQAYRTMPELGRYQGWSSMSDVEALEFLAKMNRAPLFTLGEWVQLGIAEAESERLVGDIGLHLSEDGGTGEVGFTLQPSVQGRGIAGRAVRERLSSCCSPPQGSLACSASLMIGTPRAFACWSAWGSSTSRPERSYSAESHVPRRSTPCREITANHSFEPTPNGAAQFKR